MYLSLLDALRCYARFVSRNLHVILAFMHTLPWIILAFRCISRATHYFHAVCIHRLYNDESGKKKKEKRIINKSNAMLNSSLIGTIH